MLKVRFGGIVRVVSTMPGKMLPNTEPTPPKLPAAPNDPEPPPVNGPRVETNGGAMPLPVKPKLGPVPPMKGNATNGWLHAGLKSGLRPVRLVDPLTRVGGRIIAGREQPEESGVFGR